MLLALLIWVKPLEDIPITGFYCISNCAFETQLTENTIKSKEVRQCKYPNKESLWSGEIS